jgi:large subunit ribosomal protein L30
MANKQVQVKLVKSLNGRMQKQKDTVRGLGLRKINSVSVLEDTPSVRGMINKVSFLLEIQEL